MKLTLEKAAEIVTAGYAAMSAATDEGVRITLDTLAETITPKSVFVVMNGDVTEDDNAQPFWFCVDESDLRDFLAETKGIDTLSVWRVPREDPKSENVTGEFCRRWADDCADYTVEELDDFLDLMPEFVQWHYDDELRGMWQGQLDARGGR